MIKVACVDDSAFLRQVLKDKLEASGKIQVIASLMNGKEAIECARNQKPDIMILDCEMPVMNGLDALRWIMSHAPLPVLMFSAMTREGALETIQALEYGAVDFLLKPSSFSDDFDESIQDLIKKIEFISTKRRLLPSVGFNASLAVSKNLSLDNLRSRKIDLMAMGSSTGGVQAALEIVPKLAANSPPLVWVQHMPEYFTKSFAERLDGLSHMRVCEAMDGQYIQAGNVYLARGGVQMQVVREGLRTKLRVNGKEKVSGFAPSCDVLFSSVAENYGSNALGIILTGMGSDGTKGLIKMHAKDSFVIGQDEATSIVYGMPKTAFESGSVDLQLPINRIAQGMMKVCGVKQE